MPRRALRTEVIAAKLTKKEKQDFQKLVQRNGELMSERIRKLIQDDIEKDLMK